MIPFKLYNSWPATLALLTALTGVQTNAGGIYLSAATTAPGTSGTIQYSSGPDIIPSTPNAGFYSTILVGSTGSSALATGLTLASVATTSTANGFGTATSYADANLATGLMHLMDDSNGTVVSCGGTCTETLLTATSTAAFTDLVTWQITDSAPSANVGVTFHVSGAVTGTIGSFSDHTCFSFGGAFGVTGGTNGTSIDPTACGAGGSGFTISNLSATGFDATETLNITNGLAQRMTASLQVSCQNGLNCDFMHTGALTFTLPSDVTFSSSSGVLLSQTAATAAPEPATWAITGLGLGLLGLIQRPRSAK